VCFQVSFAAVTVSTFLIFRRSGEGSGEGDGFSGRGGSGKGSRGVGSGGGGAGGRALPRALETRVLRCLHFLETNEQLFAPVLEARHGPSLADREPVRTRSWTTLIEESQTRGR
jgi:hypothetical protein